MTNETNTIQNEATRQSIRLPTIKLNPWALIADGEEHDSIAGLAHHLTVQAITCLIDVVRVRDPLSEPTFTSVIWLRKNGHIELVQETNHRRRSLGDLVADSLHIEVFQSIHDAVPFSRFHRWVADANGQFVGDMEGRKHCIRPSWDSAASIASTDAYKAAIDAIDWTRLRIEAVSVDATLNIIKKCRYREKLRNRIMKWILEGHYSPTLEKLSLVGLRRASQDHGVDFLLRYGREAYYKALSEKVHCALIDRSVQSFDRRGKLPFGALRRKPASKSKDPRGEPRGI